MDNKQQEIPVVLNPRVPIKNPILITCFDSNVALQKKTGAIWKKDDNQKREVNNQKKEDTNKKKEDINQKIEENIQKKTVKSYSRIESKKVEADPLGKMKIHAASISNDEWDKLKEKPKKKIVDLRWSSSYQGVPYDCIDIIDVKNVPQNLQDDDIAEPNVEQLESAKEDPSINANPDDAKTFTNIVDPLKTETVEELFKEDPFANDQQPLESVDPLKTVEHGDDGDSNDSIEDLLKDEEDGKNTKIESQSKIKIRSFQDLQENKVASEVPSASNDKPNSWTITEGAPIEDPLPKAESGKSINVLGGILVPIKPGTKVISSNVIERTCSETKLPQGVYNFKSYQERTFKRRNLTLILKACL